jgi:hypothetical protein
MGNTIQDDALFPSWLRDTLKDRRMRVMDLATEIARREGIDERDKEDFRRRSKAVHGHISNIINHEKNIGADYAVKIADALELPRESVMRIAGLLPTDKTEVAVPATARGKIEALLASLPPEKQDEAIRFLEAYVITQFREQATPQSSKKQKLKKA